MIVVPGSRDRSRVLARTACAVACLLALTGPVLIYPALAEDQTAEPPAVPNTDPGAAPPAESVAPPAAAATAAAPTVETADVPADAGSRIADLSGAVSVHGSGQSQWLAAVAERALASGEGVWTEPGAHARLEVSGAAVDLQEKTQLEFASLGGTDAELRLVQGALDLRVPGLARGASYQVDTPRGAVRVMLAGRFTIEAGAGDQPTRVTVLEGAAQVAGSESGLVVSSGQTALITGVDGGLSYAIEPAGAPELPSTAPSVIPSAILGAVPTPIAPPAASDGTPGQVPPATPPSND